MNEQTINKFTVGATINAVYLYSVPGASASVHVLLDNGGMLVINGDIVEVDVLGPSPDDPNDVPMMGDHIWTHA